MAGTSSPTEIAKALKNRLRHRDIKDIPAYIDSLRSAKNAFEKVYDFKLGDIVIWKKGLKNKARPALNEPAIVMEILEEPLKDETEKGAGSAYFNEPLDLVLGMIDDEGDLLIFYYDKRRFQPYTA